MPSRGRPIEQGNPFMSNKFITQLNHLGILRIAGVDASRFLQGQISCDINDITATQCRYGVHCNPKGRIITFFKLLKCQDDYLLVMPKDIIEPTLTALKKYAVFYKVTLENQSDKWQLWGLDQTSAINILNLNDDDFNDDINQCIAIGSRILYPTPRTHRRYVLVNYFKDKHNLIEKLDCGSPEHAIQDWLQKDIESGIPTITPETMECFTPHELNLQELGALNFKKGCYTGQEVIARMHYRGQLKKHLYRIEMNSSDSHPQLNEKIILTDGSNRAVGTLVNYCPKKDPLPPRGRG